MQRICCCHPADELADDDAALNCEKKKFKQEKGLLNLNTQTTKFNRKTPLLLLPQAHYQALLLPLTTTQQQYLLLFNEIKLLQPLVTIF